MMLMPDHWVEVLPARDIVAMLASDGCLDGLPFMPEMLPFCGIRFRVLLRAERTCVHPPEPRLRRLEHCVVLENLRCDGGAHGGCQLGCMLYWKESWLRRVDGPDTAAHGRLDSGKLSLCVNKGYDPTTFFCQGTELVRATKPGERLLSPWQYVRMLRVRTLTVGRLGAMLVDMGAGKIARLLRRRRVVAPGKIACARGPVLELAPGEVVEVKNRAEIQQTLDAAGTHAGLSFAPDMYAYCGRRLKVLTRVARIMDEKTGHIRPMRDTVILQGCTCERYRGCARGMPILWREVWLKRVEDNELRRRRR